MPSSDKRKCIGCGELKWADEFYLRTTGRKTERASRCKDCHREQMKTRKAARRLEPDFAEVQFRYHLRTKFGISLEEFKAKFEEQNGRCAICETPVSGTSKSKGNSTSRVHVDHDHKTGAIRSLLCHRCNLGLGLFQDDPRLLEKSARYLKLHVQGVL